jgi:FkbM family methyltransferase
MIKKIFLHRKKEKQILSSENRYPFFIRRKLLEKAAIFEAIVDDDPSRIQNLCGEEKYWESIIQSLHPKDCFWDIGSFIGTLSIFAAQHCKSGRVISIEPDPEFFARVLRHIELNKLNNVIPINVGIADKSGTMKLNSSGVKGWAPSFFSKGLDDYIDVPVITIDEFCAEHPELEPDIIKIDVEGFEGKVIRGANNTLSRKKLRMIFLELHPVFLSENKEPIGEILTTLEMKGFKLQGFEGRKNELHITASR